MPDNADTEWVPDDMTTRQFGGVVAVGVVVPLTGGKAERVPYRWFWRCECGNQGEAHTIRHCRGDLAFHRTTSQHNDGADDA